MSAPFEQPGAKNAPAARTAQTALWLGLVLAGLGVAAFGVDLRLANWIRTHDLPRDLDRLLLLAEVFAHGIGVGAILLTVVVLDPARLRMLPLLAAASLGAGGVANLLKLVVARRRPRTLPDDFDFLGSVWDTFAGWWPGWSIGSGLQSFPSSHAATAAGLAVALACFYPRGRWLFALFALLAAGQRLAANAHYLSDTLLGAAVGCLVASAALQPSLVGWFSRTKSPPRQ